MKRPTPIKYTPKQKKEMSADDYARQLFQLNRALKNITVEKVGQRIALERKIKNVTSSWREQVSFENLAR